MSENTSPIQTLLHARGLLVQAATLLNEIAQHSRRSLHPSENEACLVGFLAEFWVIFQRENALTQAFQQTQFWLSAARSAGPFRPPFESAAELVITGALNVGTILNLRENRDWWQLFQKASDAIAPYADLTISAEDPERGDIFAARLTESDSRPLLSSVTTFMWNCNKEVFQRHNPTAFCGIPWQAFEPLENARQEWHDAADDMVVMVEHLAHLPYRKDLRNIGSSRICVGKFYSFGSMQVRILRQR